MAQWVEHLLPAKPDTLSSTSRTHTVKERTSSHLCSQCICASPPHQINKKLLNDKYLKPYMSIHTRNPSTRKAEAKGLQAEGPSWAIQNILFFNPSAREAKAGGSLRVQGQPGLHREFQANQSYKVRSCPPPPKKFFNIFYVDCITERQTEVNSY